MICLNEGESANEYSRIKTRVFIADLIWTVVLLGLFQLFFSPALADAVRGISANFYAGCFIYSSLFFLFMLAGPLPLRYYSSYYIEHRFGLSNQGFSSWVIDEVKSAALSFIVFVLGVGSFYFVLHNTGGAWWIVLSFLWMFFSIVIARILPQVIIPLFFRYSTVDDRRLRDRLLGLAEKAGIRIMDICQIDFSRKTKKANAALVGLGKTRKVILTDTLIRDFSEDEIESVVAHEFGHHKYRHIWKLIIFSGAVTTAGFYMLSVTAGKVSAITSASGLHDLKILPVLLFLMLVFSLVVLPLQNAFSRVLERQSDRFALKITAAPAVFASVMRKLGAMNLSEFKPSRIKKIFFYDHPPLDERIEMAERSKS